MVKSSKVAIIGAGSVGATIAYALMLRKVCSEILLVDIDEKTCEGQVLDLTDGAFLTQTKVRKATFVDAGQCDIVVISAGAKQRPEESRVQLIDRNYKILLSVFNSMKPLNPNAIVLLVANPVDVLTYFAQKISGLPKNQVFGSGTFLDSSRLRGQIAEKLQVSEPAVHAYILGEHGDTQFPAWSSARVAGMPLLSFPQISQKELDEMAEYTKRKAYQIINLKGATYFGIGTVVSSIVEAVLMNQRHIRPVSAYHEELGCCLSLPTVLGSSGVEQVLKVPLDEKEQKQLEDSAATLKKIIQEYEIGKFGPPQGFGYTQSKSVHEAKEFMRNAAFSHLLFKGSYTNVVKPKPNNKQLGTGVRSIWLQHCIMQSRAFHPKPLRYSGSSGRSLAVIQKLRSLI